MPTMAERLSRKPKLMISRLKDTGPVRFVWIIAREGKSLTRSVPRAEPRTPPSKRKAIKKPRFPLVKVITQQF